MKADPIQPRWTPTTRLGRWAVGLSAAFVVMWIINTLVFVFLQNFSDGPWRQIVLPFYGVFMLLCGLASGIVALVAMQREHDRARLVWLTLLPWAFVIFFLLGEFLVPH